MSLFCGYLCLWFLQWLRSGIYIMQVLLLWEDYCSGEEKGSKW
jgi:hypothetical protein